MQSQQQQYNDHFISSQDQQAQADEESKEYTSEDQDSRTSNNEFQVFLENLIIGKGNLSKVKSVDYDSLGDLFDDKKLEIECKVGSDLWLQIGRLNNQQQRVKYTIRVEKVNKGLMWVKYSSAELNLFLQTGDHADLMLDASSINKENKKGKPSNKCFWQLMVPSGDEMVPLDGEHEFDGFTIKKSDRKGKKGRNAYSICAADSLEPDDETEPMMDESVVKHTELCFVNSCEMDAADGPTMLIVDVNVECDGDDDKEDGDLEDEP